MQIKIFLLQHDMAEPRGLAYFTSAAVAALRGLELPGQLRFALDLLLDKLAFHQQQLKAVDKQLALLSGAERHAEEIALLRTNPGVGPVVSQAFRLELFRPRRFCSPRQVAAYIVLSPTIRQSGRQCKEGPISRAVRPLLRWLLVEASWSWIQLDPRARVTYARLARNTGSCRKAIIGMARRLAVNLWCMLVRRQSYRSPELRAA